MSMGSRAPSPGTDALDVEKVQRSLPARLLLSARLTAQRACVVVV
jgi:hypothetical protein